MKLHANKPSAQLTGSGMTMTPPLKVTGATSERSGKITSIGVGEFVKLTGVVVPGAPMAVNCTEKMVVPAVSVVPETWFVVVSNQTNVSVPLLGVPKQPADKPTALNWEL